MASTPKALAGVGGVVAILAAAFFGWDYVPQSGHDSKPATTTTAAAKPGDRSGEKPSAKPSAKQSTPPSKQQQQDGTCPVSTLPAEVKPVIKTIVTGGKVKYPENDGVRFGNYEEHLPKQASNYYREYTVDTPGLNHRGERRIITGGTNAQKPDHWYYTQDHYETFCEIPDAN